MTSPVDYGGCSSERRFFLCHLTLVTFLSPLPYFAISVRRHVEILKYSSCKLSVRPVLIKSTFRNYSTTRRVHPSINSQPPSSQSLNSLSFIDHLESENCMPSMKLITSRYEYLACLQTQERDSDRTSEQANARAFSECLSLSVLKHRSSSLSRPVPP